ncbi:MAG: element excision factor XisH family protein, partial [Pseudanabaena sp.]
LALKLEDTQRILYLAIPETIWNTFFRREFAKLAIAEYQINLIIFDVSEERIVQWYP